MTGPYLETLGRVSFSAAIMILAVLALRLRFRRQTPQRVFCLLWDIVLVRLLLLADIPSPLSVQQLLKNWRVSAQNAVPYTSIQTKDALAFGEVYLVDGADYAFAVENAGCAVSGTGPALSANTLLTFLWLAGALACLTWLLWGHLRSKRVYAASLPVSSAAVQDWQAHNPLRRPVQVRCSDRIASPLTYGVLYPVVLLPSGMDLSDAEALSYVLAHEYTHIRRFDALRKGLLALALCLHWFNPMAWVMYYLAGRDMELACDEAVIRSGANRRSYALALLRLEEERGRGFLSGNSFSRSALEERIEAMMKIKKLSLSALVAVLAAMCIATTVFATSAPQASDRSSANGGEVLELLDGEKTWMTEDRLHAQYGNDWGDGWQVEWWTADEYAAWLEQEKQDLQDLIGGRAYTGGDGWFVWDQQRVDETIALYESILEDIRNGALYSRTIRDQNGNLVEDASLGSGGMLVSSVIDGAEDMEQDVSALLREYTAFGLSGTEQDGLFYNGQRVRYFVDGVSVGDGCYGIRYHHEDPSGTVDVHTLRAVRCNSDGSYDPMGDLTGLAARGDEHFDPDLISTLHSASGSTQNAIAGEEIEIPPYMEDLLGLGEEMLSLTRQDRASGGGKTLAEIFAQFAPYGLTCTPGQNGFVNLSYNGETVRFFADCKPDGSIFTYENPYASEGRSFYTNYNEDGMIIGLTDEMLAP